jgi:uncharacterized membrane protein YeaQ/YmgE (transglycosylase-associated protein family)
MAGLFFWAVLGGLAGGFAKSVFWFEGPQGWLPCVLFGVAGGIAGGLVRGLASAFDLSSIGLALAGAAVLLYVYGLFAQRSRETASVHRRAA